jgi:hypothetical protein
MENKKNVESWEEQFDRIYTANDDQFGHNIEVGKSDLKKLASFGGKLEILDEYTIRVTLPFQRNARNETFLFLLTKSPMPSECRYNKNKDQLTVEWHY